MFAQRKSDRPAVAAPSEGAATRPGAASQALAAVAICATLVGCLASSSAAFSAPARVAGKTVSLVCHGGGNSCTAVVSLAGGAGNERLRIALSDTDLKLVGVVAKPGLVHDAYQLSRGTYSLGGSLYTATLNAVKSISKSATLTLRFAVATQARACGSKTTV